MALILAWSLFVLGIGHIIYGLIKFRGSVSNAVSEGFVNKFKVPEIRRTAFWFLMYGPLLVFAGHASVHAVSNEDFSLLRLVGYYLLTSSIVGFFAIPKSPFLVAVVISSLLIAAGYGLL